MSKVTYLLPLAAVMILCGSLDTAAANFKPGDEFHDCDECPKMVVVPAGSFMMGSPFHLMTLMEWPQHRIHIERAFAMGKYPVTFEKYEKFARTKNLKLPKDKRWGRGSRPVH